MMGTHYHLVVESKIRNLADGIEAPKRPLREALQPRSRPPRAPLRRTAAIH
jgi:hypothetical protein